MRERTPAEKDARVKKKIISWRYIILTYCSMLLLVGMQVGIIVFPGFMSIHAVIQVAIVMGYWAVIAAIFTLITNWQIREGYDKPMRKLSEATKKVAEGDFSIYVEPMHTVDKHDYIDVIFLDFNKMVEELGSIETLKNDFIANVSHELKTPLSVIRSYASALKKEGLSSEDRNEYADTIISASDNLTALVTNILKLSRLENQEILPVQDEPYDLCRQLSHIALALEKSLEEKSIDFTAEMDDRLMLRADPGMLELVWYNLLSNAVKFTPPGGKITLTQTSDEESVTVSVSDTGCGMDAETVKHIFDKFYQGDKSHSGAGNGLGLALVKRVAELSGGIVTVHSSPGEGTTFTVRLAVK